MGREVICAHVGQQGCQLATQLWNQLAAENFIDLDTHASSLDAYYHKKYFSRSQSGNLHARAILLDTEDSVINTIKSSRIGKSLFSSRDQSYSGMEGAASNFARARSLKHSMFHSQAIDRIRTLMEECENVNCINLFCAVGGGTGGGYGSLLSEHISDLNSRMCYWPHVIFPSKHIAPTVEPFNSCFALEHFSNYAQMLSVFDNQMMYNILTRNNLVKNPSYLHLNQLQGRYVTNLLQMCNGKNTDFPDFEMGQFCTNLVPFPTANICSPSMFPLSDTSKCSMDAWSIIHNMFNTNNELNTCDFTYGRFIACGLMFRGECSAEGTLAIQKVRGRTDFVPWMPTGLKVGILPEAPINPKGSCLPNCPMTFSRLSNHTSIGMYLENQILKYNQLLQRRSFVHHFADYGMTIDHFTAVNTAYHRIIATYDDLFKSMEGLPQLPGDAEKKMGKKSQKSRISKARD